MSINLVLPYPVGEGIFFEVRDPLAIYPPQPAWGFQRAWLSRRGDVCAPLGGLVCRVGRRVGSRVLWPAAALFAGELAP